MLRFLLVSALACLAHSAASAQTALIAHRSHGGSPRTFRPARSVHNFGIVGHPVVEKIELLHGAKVVRYTGWAYFRGQSGSRHPVRQDTIDLRVLTAEQDPVLIVKRLRELYPKAKLVGFDKRKMQAAWSGTN